MLNQKYVILKQIYIIVISANTKPCVARPTLGVFDICKVYFEQRATRPSLGEWDIFLVRFF